MEETEHTNEIYEIRDLDDLFNCPVKHMEEVISAIKDIYAMRLNRKMETGKDSKVNIDYFRIKDDGINKTYLDFKGA